MRWRAKVLVAFVAVGLAFIGWYRWDSAKNRGYTFGYYGQFNTVGNALCEISAITVTGRGGNHDVTFEEFYYRIKTADGKELDLWFAEQEPVRTMSGRNLKDALLKKIKEGSSGKQVCSQEN